MYSEKATRYRSAKSQLQSLIRTDDGVCDFGIQLRCVKQDRDGAEVLPGKPRVGLVSVHGFGGRVDVVTRQMLGESPNPLVWYCSPEQLEILQHRGDASRILCYGSEGGGKTHVAAQWAILRALELVGMRGRPTIGCTAPTQTRLEMLVDKFRELIPLDTPKDRRPGSWATWIEHKGILQFAWGPALQLRATHQYSAAGGSPLQGYGWVHHLGDEWQDSIEQGPRDADVEMRLRAAPHGMSRRLCTATAKDSPTWRKWRDEVIATGEWRIARMPYNANAFVDASHWERAKKLMTPREWKRRALALDVGPERAVYSTWDRDRNLRPIPDVGARDVTAQVLARFGSGFAMLVGHDPGMIKDCSVMLRAYDIAGQICWYIVDEFETSGTTELHAARLADRLRSKWGIQYDGLQEAKALVHCDPYGDNDQRTQQSVYTVFKNAGFTIRAAAYNKRGEGKGYIGRESRIETLNSLFYSASGDSRLFVQLTSDGKIAAPKTVESIETAERDAAGKAESGRKGARDRTHYSVCVGYALYKIEKPRLDMARQQAVAL